MIKERENVIARVSAIVQSGVSVLAFILASWLSHYPDGFILKDSKEYLFFSVLIMPLWMLLIQYNQLDRMCRDQGYGYLLFKYLRLVLIGTSLLYAASLVIDSHRPLVHFKTLALFFVFDFLFLFTLKTTMFRIMKFFRRRGYNSRQILIIADEMSVGFIDHLISTKDWGYRIHGIMTHSELIAGKYGNDFSVLPCCDGISPILDNAAIDEVFYCKGNIDIDEIDRLLTLCSEVGVVFRLNPALPPKVSARSKFVLFNDEPVFVFRKIPENYLALKMKATFDLVFSAMVIVVLSPLMALIALVIKFQDGGPVFFRQERVGLNGRRFQCLKFRTMVVNAEALRDQLMNQNEVSGPVFKIKMDPRVTKFGRILRKTSLDELPQFFNVFHGDMSVVGPRPPIPAEVKQYERWQNRRLSMKPGITCIWQVSGRNEIDFKKWMEMDLHYIDNWSLKLDLIIILKTIKVMFEGTGH
jgi:exopolysaccharide biosynthesis polyprenyl glycosylphosphotransferase